MTITMDRYYLRTLVVLAALVLAASMLVVQSRPARAFPGANGKIGFDTTRNVNEEIYAMNPNST